jgi:ABC-type polysaccharide/polyol phosphate export permease
MSSSNENNDYFLIIRPGKIIRRKQSVPQLCRSLIGEAQTALYLINSELKTRIFGKSLGVFALAVDPFFQTFIYYFLTAVIFKGSLEANFLNLYVMVIFWQLFSRPLLNSATSLSSSAGIIKQTNFSLRIVFFSFFGLEFILWLINFVILMCFLWLNNIAINYNWIYLPLVLVTQVIFTCAMAFPISIIGAYIKDIPSFLGPLVGLWFYLSPGIYSKDRIPVNYHWIYDLNPFSSIFESYRCIFFQQGSIPLVGIFLVLISSLLILSISSMFLKFSLRKIYNYI